MKFPAISIAAPVLLLMACTSPVDKQEAGIETSSHWNFFGDDAKADLNAPLKMDAASAVQHDWWKSFNDPVLNSLVEQALVNNKTLAIAKARIEEARANRVGTQSALFPQVNAAGSFRRGNQGFMTGDQAVTISQATIEASWELDLFGKNQARTAEAKAILQSQEATEQAVKVALLAEVARTYFDVRNYQRQIALTKENLETQKKTMELIKAQVAGAMSSDFDVQRAGAQVSTTQSQIPSLQIAYDTALNRLNVLLGQTPQHKNEWLKQNAPLNPLNKQILVSAPASVLETRPDIRAAERSFAAGIAAKKAAKAEIFPSISLLGLFGVQDAANQSSTLWGLGGGLVQPVLNFGRIRSQIDAADAREQQLFLAYQQTVLEALENMENALSNYINENGRNASLHTATAQNRRAADLARQQFSSGYTGLLDVLVAQRNVLDAEASMTASDIKLRKDLVNIYTAAGGGWDVTGTANTATRTVPRTSPKTKPTGN